MDEITNMKKTFEREKQDHKENYEKAVKRIDVLEMQLEQQKAEYGEHLSTMTAKMQQMMKSHTNSVEAMRKQRLYADKLANGLPSTRNISIQVFKITFQSRINTK